VLLLIGLGHINNISPVLLVLSLEVAQEVVEAFIASSQVGDRRIKRLSLSRLVILHEPLNFLDFLDGLRSAGVAAAEGLLAVAEEQHAALLVLVLGVVEHHVRANAFELVGKAHILHRRQAVEKLRTELTSQHI